MIAHDIRSTHNVGSLFRTADGAGVKKIFLTGYTPTPVDSYGKERGDIAKVALGAEKAMPWEHKKSPVSVIKKLKSEGVYIVGLEQSEHSFPLHWFAKKKISKEYAGIALIVGNEVQGVSKSLLKLCDILLEIPMHGEKESLNVSVAFGIAIYALAEAV